MASSSIKKTEAHTPLSVFSFMKQQAHRPERSRSLYSDMNLSKLRYHYEGMRKQNQRIM